jgi:glutamate 5-kinase
METKLIAAEIATAAGVATIISHSMFPERIVDIIEYNISLRQSRTTPSSLVGTPERSRSPSSYKEGEHSVESKREKKEEVAQLMTPPPTATLSTSIPSSTSSISSTPIRPPHTMFTPSELPLRDLKSWTSHTLAPAGSVIIDAGAHHVLARRDSGGRLLPAGVAGILGTFASGQAVRILITKNRINSTVKIGVESEGKEPAPGMPIQRGSEASALDLAAQSATVIGVIASDVGAADSTPVRHMSGGRQLVEVGRGLANYNSDQIERIRGLKRSILRLNVSIDIVLSNLPHISANIEHVLGYADSEYVVENITIRIAPGAVVL